MLQKKKHMFKKRKKNKIIKNIKIHYGNWGLYTLKNFRYELIYLRFLKKIFRQKHIRRKIFFLKKKYWFFLKPNFILSAKSTNARMGAGIGSLVRIAIKVFAYKIFITTIGFSVYWGLKIYKKLRFKYPFKFLIAYK